jgi:DNA-binding XRE family transcriptional regulator
MACGIWPPTQYWCACYAGTKVAQKKSLKWMKNQNNRDHLWNYIRIHRRRSGLSQGDLGRVLGYRNEETVARHERFEATPPLEVAISYEIVFRVPIAQMFAGLRAELEMRVEGSLAELEGDLGARSAQGSDAPATARKLIWLSGRRDIPAQTLAHEPEISSELPNISARRTGN